MVEKWDPVLGPRDLRDPWGPRNTWNPRDIWTFEPPGTLGPLGNYLYRLKFRIKHPVTVTLRHKQRTFLNYIISTLTNESRKLCVPPEMHLILFIELLTIIIRNQSPPLLSSSQFTVIKRNDNQRHLIGYTWIEKISQFLTLQYVKISIKTTFFCYRYTKENTHFHYIRQINHNLQKHKGSIINVWQDSEFDCVAGNNLRKSSISDV